MDINKIKAIKEKISRAEIESAKAAGIVENIEKEWMRKYGTKNLQDIKRILQGMQDDLEAKNERMDKLYQDLLNSYDWDSL